MSGSTKPSTTNWFANMRTAFGVVAAPAEAQAAALAAMNTRLAGLAKTFTMVRDQAPEQALRPMQTLAGELEMVRLALADLGNARLSDGAVTLKTAVDTTLAALPGKATAQLNAHVTGWVTKAETLLTSFGGTLKGGTPAECGKRAKALLEMMGPLEAGLQKDAQVQGIFALPASVLKPARDALAALKAAYAAQVPTTTAIPTAPPPGAGARPAFPAGADALERLNTGLAATDRAMAVNTPPDPAVVAATAALITSSLAADATTPAKLAAAYKTPEQAMAALGTWDAVKQHYRTTMTTKPKEAAEFISMMWWFRRAQVDGLMATMQAKYGFSWGCVGSSNPESDYDISIRSHGKNADGSTYYDYEIVTEFNKTLSARFKGLPPGILFDTNLYAEAVVEKRAEIASAGNKDMRAMTEQGQDVGALMKLRRYMTPEAYEDNKQKTLDGLKGDAKAVAQRQFEEADALYVMACAQQLEMAEKIDLANDLVVPIEPEADLTPEAQQAMMKKAAALEADGARMMAINNAIYLEKMKQVREIEQKMDAEEDPGRKAAMLALLRTSQADATFFAAEAYHSEGPMMHVVQAGQSSRAAVENDPAWKDRPAAERGAEIDRRKQAAIDALTPNQLLQSFNENLGDLLKDLKHYGHETFPGLGFYRSSKYLERLCEAAKLTFARLATATGTAMAVPKVGSKTVDEVMAGVKKLVDIRGEKLVFDGDDQEEKKQAFAMAEMKKVLPEVTTLSDLGGVAVAFGQEVNRVTRTALAAVMKTDSEAPYFAAAGKA